MGGLLRAWRLVRRETVGQWRLLLPALGATMVAAALLTTVGAVAGGVRFRVLPRLVQQVPVDMLLVVPRQQPGSLLLGLFNQGRGERRPGLTAAQVEHLRQLPEVAAVYPRQDVQLPLGARGGARLFGHGMYTDVFAVGLPGSLLALDGFTDNPGGPVPVVIAPLLIDMFNEAVGPALGAPHLDADHLRGFGFEVVIGQSYMLGRSGRVGAEPCYIAGVSPYALSLGITVPLATATRWNRDYGGIQQPLYSGAYLQLHEVGDSPGVLAQVSGLGLQLDESSRRSSEVTAALLAVAAVVGASMLLLVLVIVSQALSLYVVLRRVPLAVFRALGAGRRVVALLVISQALVLGVVGGGLGVGVGVGAGHLADLVLRHMLPRTQLLADGVTYLPGSWAGGLVVFFVTTALLAAIRPVIRALGQPAVEVLEGR